MSNSPLPAWAEQFTSKSLRELVVSGPLAQITRDWAWGGSTGKGVRVAVIDSGVEYDHPALGHSVRGGIEVTYDPEADTGFRYGETPQPNDPFGHGTACAGIIHAIAPEADIFSVKVLGSDARGRSIQFAAGLEWAVENQMHIINMSLSSSSEDYFGMFHQLADSAYFKNVLLISAVNNFQVASYPSLYAVVVSVAAHGESDPYRYYYNPNPPVEFGAYGIDVPVAWAGGRTMVSTGNSFAAPHITGIASLIRAKHPELTPFQIKTVLHACASNVRPDVNEGDFDGRSATNHS